MTNATLGLLKTTLVDYPGMVAATVFTTGCNLRCPYCHNPELVSGPSPDDFLPVEEILRFLERRRNILRGVCITGGEPLIQPWLPEFAARVRNLGLKVKLDTNGLLPERITAVKADYIAMDIKTAPDRYGRVAGSPGSGETDGANMAALIVRSISIIRKSAPQYEFRTTVVDPVVTVEDVRAIVALLEPGDHYTLSAFRPGRTLDPAFVNANPPGRRFLNQCAAIARERGVEVTVRENSPDRR